jgi:hypothetical protein
LTLILFREENAVSVAEKNAENKMKTASNMMFAKLSLAI